MALNRYKHQSRRINPAEVVVALDIGTTKVCAAIGRKDEYGKVEVLGIGKVESKGVLRGVVSNIDKTVEAITKAIHKANKNLQIDIKDVYVGIAGQHIRSLQHRGILTRDDVDGVITKEDIQKSIDEMYKLALPPGDKILHIIPQEYKVDNEPGILDPVGMSGRRLEATYHVITGQISAVNNIVRCVERAGYRVAEITLEPIASASAVLTNQEKEAGVALIDIGGGTTDITVFYEGIIRHTAVIPFGGNIITRDIKEGCTVMNEQAEKLKVRFGSALAEEIVDNRIITIPGLKGHKPKEISERNLALIIQARADEILRHAAWEIKKSNFSNNLVAGVVLTGGGSLLKHIDKLYQYKLGMNARLGKPVEHLAHGYAKELSSPIFSTVLGLLIQGVQEKNFEPVLPEPIPTEILSNIDRDEELEPVPGTDNDAGGKKSWIGILMEGARDFFAPSPDTNFH